tara:strand:- start:20507 stop:21271 length:765 start_codon:yes stop_codon:yes gene_type:complete
MFNFGKILLISQIVSSFGVKKQISKTPRQEKYSNFLSSDKIDLVVATGPAGTGKTYFACESALEQLKNNNIKKIILTRPLVTLEDEDVGFLPGNLNEKFAPFSQPIFEYFKNDLTNRDIENCLKIGTIEASPIGFLRGRTFDNSYIIADEMQNSSPKQLLMLLTRLGENSKLVITGDVSQCDLAEDKQKNNGLQDLLNNLENYYPSYYEMLNDNIATINFGIDDCKRSDFVKKIIEIYDHFENDHFDPNFRNLD